MKQSLLLSFVLLSLSLSSLVTPIHGRGKGHHATPPSQSSVGSPAPGPSNSDCSSVIFSMMDCLTYLTIGSNETKPAKACCDGIETVLQYNPICICSGLESAGQMGVALNNTRALATPKDCKLSIAPPHCGVIPGAMTPGASTTPGVSPVSPSAGTPKTSPSAVSPPAATPKTSPSAVSPPAATPKTSPSAVSPSAATSPSAADTPSVTTPPSPSTSSTNSLSVPALTLVAFVVSSIAYILALSN